MLFDKEEYEHQGIASVTLPTYTYRYGFNGQERESTVNDGVYAAEYWFYDGRLGRRWNVDPVDQVSMSNYSCYNNNPIWFNDMKGDSSAVYGTNGKFIGFVDDGKKEWSGKYAVPIVKIDTKTGLDYNTNDVKYINFTFNDPDEDIKLIKQGKVTNITVVTQSFINDQMNRAFPDKEILDENIVKRINYFNTEGAAGGNLDFGINFCVEGTYKTSFMISGGTAYNIPDFGNFLIGYAAAHANIPLFLMQLGGQKNHIFNGQTDVNSCYNYYNTQSPNGENMYKPGLLDSAADQRAIRSGYEECEDEEN